ncbi:hypothetical protein ACS0TY_006552 [Phlomoides rotata]
MVPGLVPFIPKKSFSNLNRPLSIDFFLLCCWHHLYTSWRKVEFPPKISGYLNLKDFVLVLHYALRSVRNFVKHFVREMESVNWDIEAVVNAIQPGVIFSNGNHKAFVFESFVCREILSGFNDPVFSIE